MTNTAILAIAVYILSSVASAAGGTPYGGVGLSYDMLGLSSPSSTSQFAGQGYLAEVGAGFSFGGQLRLDYAHSTAANITSGPNLLELAGAEKYSAKLGYSTGSVYFGLGYQNFQAAIKSMSANGYAQTNYSGSSMLGYLGAEFATNKNLKFSIHAEYFNTPLKPSDATLPSITASQISLSLRLFFLFN